MGRGVQADHRHVPPSRAVLCATASFGTPTASSSRSSPATASRSSSTRRSPASSDEVEERTFSFFLYEKAEKAQYVEEYAKLLHDAFARRPDALRLDARGRRRLALHRPHRRRLGGGARPARDLRARLPTRSCAQAEAALAAARRSRASRRRRARQDGGGARAQPARARLAGRRLEPSRRGRRARWPPRGWWRRRSLRELVAALRAAARDLADGAGRRARRRAALRLRGRRRARPRRAARSRRHRHRRRQHASARCCSARREARRARHPLRRLRARAAVRPARATARA